MKKFLCLMLAFIMILFCTACGWKNPELLEDQIPIVLPDVVPDTTVANPLTGEPLQNPDAVNNRPVAVMLNNIHLAMPQHGVSVADIIYEYNVEGAITRMVGFYQDISTIGTIGSVRSARPYFVKTVYGMDAIYVHAGGSSEGMWWIYELDIDHIDEADFDAFWRDEKRYETMDFEHTLMTSGERISNVVADYGWRTKHTEDFSYPFTYVKDGTPHNGVDATDIDVWFSHYKTGTFDYDANTGLYMVGQYDDAYIDGNTGAQVGVTNVIVLFTSMYEMATGHMSIDVEGSGTGMYFCGGKGIPINWHKEELDDPFTYTLADGTPFSLGVGKSYVCIVDEDSDPLSYS